MSIDINPQTIADALKAEGNELFKSIPVWSGNYSLDNEFQKACDKYTSAIDIFPSAILYC